MASNGFKVTITGDTAVIARFKRISAAGHSFVRNAITSLRLQDEALVKQKLSGDVLNVRSGALRRSIFSNTDDDGGTITGTIASSGDVKYAAIHEFGGTIRSPGGTAYLVIAGQGATFISNTAAGDPNVHIAGRTQAHDITMPERSFLRSSLAEMAPQIASTLRDAVMRANRA